MSNLLCPVEKARAKAANRSIALQGREGDRGWCGGGDQRGVEAARRARVARHSSGWDALQKFLRESEGQRTLDIGPTSSTNINLLTGMGHSVYMADLVTEAQDPQWTMTAEDGSSQFRTADFLAENLQLKERTFDIVLLWDALDFLPPPVVKSAVACIHDAMVPGGKCLVLSHIRQEGTFGRYHLRQDASVDVQSLSDLPIRQVYTNRQVETMFSAYAGHKFFLAKDNLREVLITR